MYTDTCNSTKYLELRSTLAQEADVLVEKFNDSINNSVSL